MTMKDILAAAAVILFAGRAWAAEIPPLDRQVPARLRTASFALG